MNEFQNFMVYQLEFLLFDLDSFLLIDTKYFINQFETHSFFFTNLIACVVLFYFLSFWRWTNLYQLQIRFRRVWCHYLNDQGLEYSLVIANDPLVFGYQMRNLQMEQPPSFPIVYMIWHPFLVTILYSHKIMSNYFYVFVLIPLAGLYLY